MIPFGIKIHNTGTHTVAGALAQYRAGKWNAAIRQLSEGIGHEQNECLLQPYRCDSQ